MPVRVRWSFAFRAALLGMPWRKAADVAAAVLRFAETREGWVTRTQTDPLGLWLYVGGWKVRLRVSPSGDALDVLYVWRIS